MVERGAFSQESFSQVAQDVVLYLHVTSHVSGVPHARLFTEKGGTAFPRFLILDPEGEVLAVGKGPRTAEGFRSWIERGEKIQAIAGKTNATAQERLLLLETKLEASALTYEEAAAAREGFGTLNEALERRFQKLFLRADARSLLGHGRRLTGPQRLEVGRRLLAHLEEGRVPEAFSEKMNFFDAILDTLASAKEFGKYRSVLDRYASDFARYPNVMKKVQQHRKRLAEEEGSSGRK